MRGRKYTDEFKREIAWAYDRGVPLQQISEDFGIDQTLASKVAREMGCKPRRERKKGKNKVCPKCRHKNPLGSNFCNHCGTDIRSEEDIMVKKIEDLRECIFYIANPDAKAKADSITIALIKYFEGKENAK